MESRRTRLYVFPGGVLETTDYGDGDCGGVYIEFTDSALPQRVPDTSELPAPLRAVEFADTATCGRVLRLLREREA